MKGLSNSVKTRQLIPYSIIVMFSICVSLALFMNGDDYIWYFSREDELLSSWRQPNGRFFSNQVTYCLVRSTTFRIIFVSTTFSLFLYLLCRLFDYEKKMRNAGYYITIFLFVLMPPLAYAESVGWISGYSNYIISIFFLLIYILFFYKCLFDDYYPKTITAALFLPLSIAGGLCVEHITIYNLILSISAVIFIIKFKRKGLPHAISFFIGTCIAAFLMFIKFNYGNIYYEGDAVGNRGFELDYSDILQHAYLYVVMHYTKDYWILVSAIITAITVLYFKHDFTEKKPKYLNICISICWLYSVYSIFTGCFSDFKANTPTMKIIALETAFSFIYSVSIAYLIGVFLNQKAMIRAYIYLISTLILTLPFLVVSPVTYRCFLANYMFWLLICGEFVSAAFSDCSSEFMQRIRKVSFFAVFAALFMISFICLSNKYYDVMRYEYIREQLEDDKKKSLNIILLPYSDYTIDDLAGGIYNEKESIIYGDYRLKYHNIDSDNVKGKVCILCSPNDYYIEKDE